MAIFSNLHIKACNPQIKPQDLIIFFNYTKDTKSNVSLKSKTHLTVISIFNDFLYENLEKRHILKCHNIYEHVLIYFNAVIQKIIGAGS